MPIHWPHREPKFTNLFFTYGTESLHWFFEDSADLGITLRCTKSGRAAGTDRAISGEILVDAPIILKINADSGRFSEISTWQGEVAWKGIHSGGDCFDPLWKWAAGGIGRKKAVLSKAGGGADYVQSQDPEKQFCPSSFAC